MATDLTSQKWLDIVFDGKNKDFGAYQMRQDTGRRHTKATIIVLGTTCLILLLLFIFAKVDFNKVEEEGPDASVEQALANLDDETQEEEEEVMEEIEMPEPEEIMEQEEVANTMQNTIFDIVEDDKAVNQIHTQDELAEDDRAIGSADISDGVDDATKVTVTQEVVIVEEKPVVDDIVYTVANVQQKPEFPGGEQALYQWLGKNIVYPAQAAEDGVSGRVVVGFTVSKTGAIENVKVIRGKHPALDKEAIRVVKAMPKWTPGRNNGQPVKVDYTLPVTFKLEGAR